MMHRRARVCGLAVLAALLSAGPAVAQARNHLYDKFQVFASGSSVILNSNVRVDGQQNGTDLDAEDDLGLDQFKLQPRGMLRWRPGKRHELEIGYQFARRSGQKILERDFTIGDSVFTAGLDAKTTFDTDQAFFAYRFAFLAKENTQVGVALGLGALFLDVGVDAVATVSNGGGSASGRISQSRSLTGPLGSIGLFGRFHLGKEWYLDTEARGVSVSIDRFTARVLEGGGALRYHFAQHWGGEFGYGVSAIRVTVEPKEDGVAEFEGQLKYSLQNVRIGLIWVP